MAHERRELPVPADSFEFTNDGRLVVSSDRIAKAVQDAGLNPGSTVSEEGVSVGVVVTVPINI